MSTVETGVPERDVTLSFATTAGDIEYLTPYMHVHSPDMAGYHRYERIVGAAVALAWGVIALLVAITLIQGGHVWQGIVAGWLVFLGPLLAVSHWDQALARRRASTIAAALHSHGPTDLSVRRRRRSHAVSVLHRFGSLPCL